MDRVTCQICHIPYRRRSLTAHQANCSGGVKGFTPVHDKGRFMYRCHGCGREFRKGRIQNHQKTCCNDGYFGRDAHTKPQISSTDNHDLKPEASVQIHAEFEYEDKKAYEEKPFVFEKLPEECNKSLQFFCPVRKQLILIEEENDSIVEEEQLIKPLRINQQLLQREKIQASLTKLTTTKQISKHPKLSDFRVNLKTLCASTSQTIEIYALSCLLRLVGRFTHEKKWEQARGLIKRSDYWEFVGKVQPWIVNTKSFIGIAEEKLKYFSYDVENYRLTNFDFVYQRVKGLLEIFWINRAKLQSVFIPPVHKRQGRLTRIRRKNPQTAKFRAKLAHFRSRSKRQRNKHKNPYGIRKLTQLKYRTIQYQVEAIDEAHQMKQVFRKKPSHHHKAQIARKRQRMMFNFCMKTIADELTAAVVLGQFKIWSKSIQDINPEQRYLYVDQIPSIPSFQFWYPLTMDILKERKWFYPYVYQQCRSYFESPLPELSQDQIFSKFCSWYRTKGLIINHSLYELDGFDGIRALLDDKYRIEQQKKRIKMQALTIQVNPRVIFAEDVEEDSVSQISVDEDIVFAADVPSRGDPKKWAIVHESEHKTGFNCCAICEKPLKFPAPSCKTCLTTYHYSCLREISHHCLCFALFGNSQEKMRQMLDEAINTAKNQAKHVDLKIKTPPKASMMELKYQKENIEMNMEAMTRVGLWCLPGSITYHQSSKLMYLRDKNIVMLENLGKSYVFPGSVEVIPGKGRGVIATRDIKKDELVAVYPGALITQAQIIESYKGCKYIFNFQEGPTPFTSWAIVPVGVAHLGMFINHGTPNVIPTRFWSSKGPLLLFISLRKISMGDEILYDYGQEYHGHEGFV